jgi:hypothetical protein
MMKKVKILTGIGCKIKTIGGGSIDHGWFC